MARIGRPPGENPRKRQIGLKVTASEHARIMELAAKRGWSASEWVAAVMLMAAMSSRSPREAAALMVDWKDDLEVLHVVMTESGRRDQVTEGAALA